MEIVGVVVMMECVGPFVQGDIRRCRRSSYPVRRFFGD